MNKSALTLIIASLVAATVISCGSNEPRGDFRSVDVEGWAYGDSLFFDLEAADSIWQGDIAIVVRHAASYPYSNLWLEVSYPTDSIAPDTINVALADDFGNWYGRGLGLSYQLVDTALTHRHLDMPSKLAVRHIMRCDRLTDIEQIGIVLFPQSKKH